MASVLPALAPKITQWKEDFYFDVKCERQKLSKYYAGVTPMMGMLLISAHILDPIWKLPSYRKWDKGMDINPEDETSYTAQYQEAFLHYVENEYCAQLRHFSVTKHEELRSNDFIPSATASQSGQSSCDPYDRSSIDEEYLTPKNVAETTPGRCDRPAHWLTAARLDWSSKPESPNNWGQVGLNLDDYHSDSIGISSTFWLPDITESWCQQEETHSKYTDFSNVTCNIFSIIPDVVRVDDSSSLGRDIIGWRQSKTPSETLWEKVVVRQYAWSDSVIVAGDDPALDRSATDNELELKREAEERILHRMAKVHDILEMWQGSQNLRSTKKESHPQNKQMTAIGYISDTADSVKASWSLFQHDGAAAFKLSERSLLPPALSAKEHAGEWTKVLNVCRLRRIDRHPARGDDDSASELIPNSENWVN